MADKIIELKNVTYTYPLVNHPAVKNISLSLEPGKLYGIIGGNGSGKTTLCVIVCGFATKFEKGKLEGEVLIKGKDVDSYGPGEVSKMMGYVLQNPFSQISGVRETVLEEIAYGLENLGMNPEEMEEKVVNIARKTDIEGLLMKNPFELSGGQQQRVGIARALAASPDILLMDEPFGAVDEITRIQLQAELKQIHEQTGITVLFVTHDISEALKLGTKVLVMNDGKIEQFAKPEDLLRSPATEFVKELVKKERRTCYLPEDQLSSCEFSGTSGKVSSFDAR